MKRVTAIVNGSGSVGKTTLTLALAALASAAGRRVCVVDLDPQGNATTGAGCLTTKPGLIKALAAVTATHPADDPDDLATRADLVRRTLQTSPSGFAVLGAGTYAELQGRVEASTRDLPTLLAAVVDVLDFDVILLDCHGDLGPLTRAAMTTADQVLAVTILGGKEVRGLPEVIALSADLPGAGPVIGIVPTQVAAAEVVDREYLAALRQQWPDLLAPSVRRAAAAKQAFAQAEPVPVAFPKAPISDDFRAVHEWLATRGVL